MNADLDAVFGALADPTRRRIVERLARKPLTIGEIGKEFPISQPAISKHVRILEDAGLLERTIEGRVHYCTLAPHTMEQVLKWIERQRRYWNAALDRLEKILVTEKESS
ncbi:MAG TPA: metalloregulator ArsR/SmtB family transcription factor [Candidatus Baltobacteraceae bacterium]|nr:metalloregulator ArsR/SmtB family transcription factor [Candidatus Baltobacteraceae bacterium]